MGQRSIVLAIALIIFTVILAIVFVIGRVRTGNSPKEKVEETVVQTEVRDTVAVKDIIATPMVYNGVNLEVDSKITGWATNRAFFFSALLGSGFGGGTRRNLLVVAKEPFTLPQNPNDGKVGLGELTDTTAKGKIEVLNEAQLEELMGIDFDDPNNNLYSTTLQNWVLGPVLVLGEVKPTSATK